MKNFKKVLLGKASLLLIAFGLTSCATVFASNNYTSNFHRDTIIPITAQQSFIDLYNLKQKGLLNTAKDDGDFWIFERKQPLSLFRVEKRLWQIFMLGTLTELSTPNTSGKEKLSNNVDYKDFPLLYSKLNADKDHKSDIDQRKNLISFQFKNSSNRVNLSDWSLYSKGIFAKNPRYSGAFKTE